MKRSGNLRAADAREQPGLVEFAQDRPHAHRRLDVAAVVGDVVDVVAVVHDQRHLAAQGGQGIGRRRRRLDVAGRSRAKGAIADRTDHLVDIGRRAQLGVFAFEDGADDLAQLRGLGQDTPAEAVEHQERHVAVALAHRQLVERAGDGKGTIALVEFQARRVLLADRRIGAGLGVVGQAFEIEAVRAEGRGLLAHPVVEGAADARSAARTRCRRNDLEIGEQHVGIVQGQGDGTDPLLAILGDEQLGNEAVAEGVVELIGQLVDVLGRQARELGADNLLGVVDRGAVRRRPRIPDLAYANHVRLPSVDGPGPSIRCGRSGRRSPGRRVRRRRRIRRRSTGTD